MPIRVPVVQTGLEASIQAAAKKAGKAMKIDMGAGAKSIEGLSQPLGRITGKADQFTKSMEAANARVLAFGASVGVLSAVTRGFKELVTATIEVEKRLTSINTILGTSTSQLDSFRKTIFAVARDTEQSFDTVSNAALELSRQGLSAEKVIKRLNDSLILSRLSGLGASEAVSGLTAAINSFRKEGVTSAEVLNKLSAAAVSAAVSERDLIEGIKRSGSVATLAGVSLNELVGVISAVQEKTARGGAVIGNSFKTIFTRIQSLEKLKTMQDLGVQVTDTSGAVLGATTLIQNLARTIESLPDAKKLQIAENLVGKFQVAPFLAILDDYISKTSVAIKVTEVSANATNEAYSRNVALNKTLSAAINEATVNLKELGATLGEIGVTDSLQNVLSFFNTLVGNVKDLLQGEGVGSDFAKGIVKGIGGVLSGPGLAIFGAIIAKLTLDLAKFGLGSLKTFFGLNKAAQQQAALQGQIASTLLGNKEIQKHILNIENSTLSTEQKRASQIQFFTIALNEQLAIMTKMQGIAAKVAPGVMRGTRGGGRAAGGYIPNFNAVSGYGSERGDIARGVGGAPPSARPVNIPNFNFGGGQRGSITANSSEFIVPNFAGKSGSAIFNQNMVSSMGLPTGARKIGAARGYVPNFNQSNYDDLGSGVSYAEANNSNLIGGNGQISLTKVGTALKIKGKGRDAATQRRKAAAQKINNARKNNKTTFFANKAKGGGGFLMLVPQVKAFDPDAVDSKFTDPFNRTKAGYPKQNIDFFEGGAAGVSPTIDEEDSDAARKFRALTHLDQVLTDSLEGGVNAAVSNITSAIEPNIDIIGQIKGASIVDELEKGGRGAFGALRGAVFEKIMTLILPKLGDSGSELDVDFDSKRKELELIFGLDKKMAGVFSKGDFKNSLGQASKYRKQVLDAPFRGDVRKGKKTANSKGAASGYIPSFANGPLEEAINRESSAGVPINQIRVNQSGSLRNASNPMGLAVTNTRDEPTGSIPTAAGGFVPNFMVQPSVLDGAKKNAEALRKSAEATKGNTEETDNNTKAQRDLLGPIFAVQAGMSFLSASTADATGGMGRFTNRLSESLGGVTTAAFAGTALNDFGKQISESGGAVKGALGGLVSKVGVYGGLLAGAASLIQGARKVWEDHTGVTDTNKRAMEGLTEATKNAARTLEDLSLRERRRIEGQAEALTPDKFQGFFQTRTDAFEKTFLRKLRPEFEDKPLLIQIGGRVGKEQTEKGTASKSKTGFFERGLEFQNDETQAGVRQVAGQAIVGGLSEDFVKKELIRLGLQQTFIALEKASEGKGLKKQTGPDKKQFAPESIVPRGERFEFKVDAKEFEAFVKILDKSNKVIPALRKTIAKQLLSGRWDGITLEDKKIQNKVIRQETEKRLGLEGAIDKELVNQLIAEQEIKNVKASALEDADKATKIDQIRSDLAKTLLKITIDRKKAELNNTTALKSQLKIAELIGNKTTEQKRVIRETLADRELDKKLTEQRLSLLTDSAAKLKELVNNDKEVGQILTDIGNLKRKDLDNTNALEKITRRIVSLNVLTEVGLDNQLRSIIRIHGEKLKSLGIDKESLKAALEAEFSAERRRDALIQASQALSNMAAGDRFGVQVSSAEEGNRLRARRSALGRETDRGVTTPERGESIARDQAHIKTLLLENERRASEASFLEKAVNLSGDQRFRQAGEVAQGNLTDQARSATNFTDAIAALETIKGLLPTSKEGLEATRAIDNLKREEELKRKGLDAAIKLSKAEEQLADARTKSVNALEFQITQLERMGKAGGERPSQLRAAIRRQRAADETKEGGKFEGLTPANAQLLSDMQRSAAQRVLESPEFDPITNADVLNEKLKDAAINFKNTMSDAMVDAIIKGENLGDVLRGAATDFFTTLAKAYMNNAVNTIVGNSLGGGGGNGGGGSGGSILSFLGGLVGFGKKATGGLITGGSGHTDDVPTLLQRGEFVVRRDSVEKYGAGFLEELNTGRIGQMQKGGHYSPGTYGQGAISGKRDLLDFATQSHTSGQFDQIRGGAGFGSVALEPQSGALTMFGRRNSASYQREQQSKGVAAGLYFSQIKKEAQLKEAQEAQGKAFMNSIKAAVGAAAFSALVGGIKKQHKINTTSMVSPETYGTNAIDFSSVVGAGRVGGGGASSVLSNRADNPRPVTNREVEAAAEQVRRIQSRSNWNPPGITNTDLGGGVLLQRGWQNPQNWENPDATPHAHGGAVPHAAGIDTVPTMLSGGEFVMNAAATQNIGRGNLAALNSGGGGDGGDGAIVTAINNLGDELGGSGESVINITVNSDGTQTEDGNGSVEDQNLAARLGDVVRAEIQEQQRLGGLLHRT